MTGLKNELIRASAGTGKTHALVQRYLWLLAHGAEPERIAAMTFTRKAAGEFFERILQELAGRSLAPEGGAESLKLLRKMVRRMDKLRLGTIDSFFASMVLCLPFELGLTGKASLMGEEEAAQAMEEVLDALLLTASRMSDRAALDELREAWKAAGHGHEQGRPAEALGAWCGRLHQLLIECPDMDRWGGASFICPDQPADLSLETLASALAELRSTLDMSLFKEKAVQKWDEFFAAAAAYDGFQKLGDSALGYMLEAKRGDPRRLRAGNAPWLMFQPKPVMLDKASGAALANVLDLLVGCALAVNLRRTRAQREVMGIYETSYRRLVRSRGRLVFSDLAWLLCGRLSVTGKAGESWEALRMALEYRMDSRHDHWLLDEFQDTSERQWEVMAPLLEEARQDPEARRSVFLVGDLKQSIYLWRQAEPELFHHVERSWQGERLQVTPLNESFRSCPEVLAMVNGVFDGAAPELEGMFSGINELWQYEKHRCSARVAGLKGHAALLHVPPAPEDSDEASITLAAAALVRHMDPLARGLTCAVLVRSNHTARVISESLRALLGMEVICESRENVAVDNPATLALLSLLQLSVHPGDTAAWWHVSMTPLQDFLQKEGLTREALSARLRRDLAAGGFLPVLRSWAGCLREALPLEDPFTARRFAQLLDLAAGFDETGSRDVDAFLRRAREHTVREDGATAQAIQVMTIHQSKGLQFDVVILPELQGEALDTISRNRLIVSRGPRGTVQWLLDKPEKVVAERIDILRAELDRERARQAFEGLCRFYVAMTRARLGLYVLLEAKKIKAVKNEGCLLTARLQPDGQAVPYPVGDVAIECAWESGDRKWHEGHPVRGAAAPEVFEASPAPELGALIRSLHRPLERRAPSGEESFKLRGADLLSPVREGKRLFGTRVHELLSLVSWLEEVVDLPELWRSHGLVQGNRDTDDAMVEALRVLKSPEASPWFRRDGKNREAWMERRFDFIHEGGWISGTVDRVVLERDARGNPVSAMILDFKTDAVTTEEDMQAKAAGYAPQIQLYVAAVSRLTGLEAGSIRTAFVFTANGRVVTM